MESNKSVSTYSNNTTSYTEIEKASLSLVLCIVICSTLYIIFDIVVILALRRTKTVPNMARFLAISLLLCYACIAIITLCRRVIGSINNALVILKVTGIAIRLTSYTIIAMLAIDRVVVIQFPFFYCRYVPSVKVKSVAVLILFIIFLWCFVGLIWKCDLTATQSEFAAFDRCFKDRTPPFVGSALVGNGVTVLTCLCIISKTLYKQSKIRNMRILTGMYKTTIAIFGNVINYIAIVVIYIIAVVSLDSAQSRLLTLEVLAGLNALLDTVLYALWFKECRLELLKIATICVPKLEQKVERLRYQVFSIQNAADVSQIGSNAKRI